MIVSSKNDCFLQILIMVSIVKVNATPKKILLAFNLTNRRVAFK